MLPSLSARRWSPSLVHRIPLATRLAVLSIKSCASTFRAVPAIGSGSRRHDVPATRRSAWTQSASTRWSPLRSVRWIELPEPVSCRCVSSRMIEDVLFVDGAAGARPVRLGEYLEPAAEQRAEVAEYVWIKQLRHLDVDGQPHRRRFT